MRCTGSGGDGSYGNVGHIQTSRILINSISAFLCSFSTSQCVDSIFRFLSCGASISHFNSSFCHSADGSATTRSDSNTSAFDTSYMTCNSGVSWALIESTNAVSFKKCSFINLTKVTSYMIVAYQRSIFDSCNFFQMTPTKPKFYYKVTLINCCSDESISGYTITVYSNIDDFIFPVLKEPECKRANVSPKRCSKRQLIYWIINRLMI